MPAAAKLGRPKKAALRSVVEAMLYMASTDCQWRAIPKDFRHQPPEPSPFAGTMDQVRPQSLTQLAR